MIIIIKFAISHITTGVALFVLSDSRIIPFFFIVWNR